MPPTPGWKWDCKDSSFDVLPAVDDDNISEMSSDSDDGMSMSMMTVALEELQKQLEIKKLKMAEKSRRRSCPQTMTSRFL